MELVSILLMLFVIFVAAKLASLLFSKFGIPGLVGEILVGIILAISIGDSSIAQFLGLSYTYGQNDTDQNLPYEARYTELAEKKRR